MPNESAPPPESGEPEPTLNPVQFYSDQADQLGDQPALQKLVRERAAALTETDLWATDPVDMQQGIQEAIRFLHRSIAEPISTDNMPTIIDVSETKAEDQELSAELVALLQGDPSKFTEGMPQAGPMVLGQRGNSYVESRLPIALPGWQLVRSRYLSQVPGQEDLARYKYYLEA